MKKLIVLLISAMFAISCTKEIIVPQVDLSLHMPVDIHTWHDAGGPMKLDYYIYMGNDQPPIRPWYTVIDLWNTANPFYPSATIYVLTTDYNVYLKSK